jgi:multiple antibiotic resistance protein
MNTYLHSTIAMLAVINPVVCGTMILQASQHTDKKNSILNAVKAMLVVLVILLVSALAGKTILHAFGISMDAFKIVGGIILAFIGFQMLGGPKDPSMKTDKQSQPKGLTPVIMFAASPGTISMVITLSAVHNAEGLPLSAMIGTTLAIVLTMGIIIAMLFLSGKKKGRGQGITTRFMGFIIVAMGLQFMLDGIKDFF